jgi:predicted ATPase
VMLGPTGDVKLLDFGIAAHARREPDLDTDPDALAGIIGTVSYMSPEQAAGEQTDFRSDQFSFGSILYEAASTVHPFRSANAAQTLATVLRAAARPLNELCPAVPDPLRWIIERCLAREPGRRYATTDALHRELAMLRTRLFEVTPTDHVPSVPVPRTAIIGRSKELATAARLVLESEARLVTLTGPGGVGKTRLAFELAATLAGRFGSRVIFVDLSPVRDAGDVGKTIATTLGVRDATEMDVTSALRRWIRERQHSPMLLVIDNFEHVLDAAPLVGELLAASKSLTVLATSRAVLRLAGEHDVTVPPLALPDIRQTTLEQLSSSAAVALFVERATAAKSDFVLTQDNAVAIARICERLDGLPLAIELAAARVRLLSPAAILSRLEHRLDVLTDGPRDAPRRQQSFRAALEWSEELLDPSERMLFRRMAVFSGGCTSEAVEAVCNTRQDVVGNIEVLLGGLVDKNMIVVLDAGEPLRVTQLETIREYAQERLAASNDGDLTRRAHAAYCLILAEEGYGLRGRDQSHWMRRSELEYPNFRSAYEWLLENQQFEWGVRLTSALMPFWEARALLAEGLDWINRLLLLPRRVQPPVWRARALSNSCFLLHLQGDVAAWMPRNAEVLEAFSQLADWRSLAQAKVSYGVVFAQIGRHEEARAQVEEGLALWRQVGDERGEARALANLATFAKITGDTIRARQLCQRSRELFEQNGDREGVAWSLNHEADAARWAGDLESSRALLHSALNRFRAVGDDAGAANCLVDLATISVEEDPQNAEQHAVAALRLLMTTGHSLEIARALETLARVAWEQEVPERALRLAGAVAAIRRKFGGYGRLELRHPDDALILQRLITDSQERTGARATTLWMEGWAAPLAETLEYALARPH